MLKRNEDLFSHQFSPFGQAGGSHLLRYSGVAIRQRTVVDGCAVKCLAYGRLQLAQNSARWIVELWRQSMDCLAGL